MKIVLLAALTAFVLPFTSPAFGQTADIAEPEAGPAPAEDEAAEEAAVEPVSKTETVVLNTAAGVIVLEIETERAPVTAANFLRYVEADRLRHAAFYRSSKKGGYEDDVKGFIQFGLRQHPDHVFPPIAHESTAETGLSHVDGAISMVRGAPGTADADYLIMVGDQPAWDARDDGTPGYAVFGKVVQGMETVRAIWDMPIDPDEGEGVLRGEILADEVDVIGAEVTTSEESQ
ncbi:MAG: peptidylprolyl isomerase [Pacificimonas sp.]|jgi:peptidyl-prolyl cis-trans isomerase A (cyclophilin A)|nr:peptidylprolyl isomerase [Pacificimonas sp.]